VVGRSGGGAGDGADHCEGRGGGLRGGECPDCAS
jgi:hypothetical protein